MWVQWWVAEPCHSGRGQALRGLLMPTKAEAAAKPTIEVTGAAVSWVRRGFAFAPVAAWPPPETAVNAHGLADGIEAGYASGSTQPATSAPHMTRTPEDASTTALDVAVARPVPANAQQGGSGAGSRLSSSGAWQQQQQQQQPPMQELDAANTETQVALLVQLNDRVRVLSDQLREQEKCCAEAERREGEAKNQLEHDTSALNLKLAERNHAVATAQKEARRYAEALEKAKAESVRVKAREAELDATIAKGRQQVEAQNQAIQELRAKSDELRKLLTKEKQLREKDAHEKEALKLHFQPLKERNIELEYRLDNQRDAMRKTDAEVTRLTGALKAQADAADALSQRLRTEVSERQRVSEQAARKHLQLHELYEGTVELEGKLEHAEREREEARTALVATVAELNAARSRLESMERHAADDRLALAAKARALAERTAACEDSDDLARVLEDELSHACEVAAEAQNAHAQAAGELTSLKEALGELLSVYMAPAGGRVPFREKAEAEVRLGRLLKSLRAQGVSTVDAIALRSAKSYDPLRSGSRARKTGSVTSLSSASAPTPPETPSPRATSRKLPAIGASRFAEGEEGDVCEAPQTPLPRDARRRSRHTVTCN